MCQVECYVYSLCGNVAFNIGNSVDGWQGDHTGAGGGADVGSGEDAWEDSEELFFHSVQPFSACQVSGVRGGAYLSQFACHVATCLEDSIFRVNVGGRGGAAYLEYSVITEGCCHDRGRAEDDKSSEKELSFVEHDEVARKEENVESTSDCAATWVEGSLLLDQL